MAIRTVFVMSEECSRGEPEGWLQFVRDYTWLVRQLLERYFPTLAPEMKIHELAIFQRARANQNEWFRKISFSNEREFLMALRELVFTYGREVARVPVPQLSLEQVGVIMKDLNVLEREMLWMFIKGYSAQQIAPIMLNASATAEAVKKIADERLIKVLPGSSPDAFNISARVLVEQAERARSEQCLPLKTFNNIINGQASWRERELAEQHIKDCFNCLDRYTAFQEMVRFSRDFQSIPEEEVSTRIRQLNLPAPKSKSVLGRLFSRA